MAGEASVAAPIEDRRGVTVGAIGISGPVERLCDEGEVKADSCPTSARPRGPSPATSARSRGELPTW